MKNIGKKGFSALASVVGLVIGLFLVSSEVSYAQSASQAYPDRPIKIVVPFPPGALTDSIGRALAEKLRVAFGQPVVIENRPGAGTLVGASQVAKSAPDGYTLMVATSTTLGIAPFLFPNAPVKITDLTGVAMIGTVTLFLVTRPDFPARSLQELVTLLRRSPGKYNFASPGNGTVHHLVIEMLKSREKVSAVHIPYQGSVTALTDVITGRMDFMFVDAAVALPQLKAGKLKALAVTGAKRSALAPDVPAVGEVFKGLEIQAWQSIAAPQGLAPEIQNKLHAAISASLATAEFKAQLAQMGVDANPMGLGEFNEMIKRDASAWQAVIKQSGAKVD